MSWSQEGQTGKRNHEASDGQKRARRGESSILSPDPPLYQQRKASAAGTAVVFFSAVIALGVFADRKIQKEQERAKDTGRIK